MTRTEIATLGGGCFWCVEAAFEALPGVVDVTSGYAGGHADDPTYGEVCSGSTGHAEVVQIAYDGDELAYADVLKVFFTVHDPTQLNRQGPDVGSQYRSIVLTHDAEQAETAAAYVEQLDAEGVYDDEIVTEIEPLETFYRAEEKHQNYYEKNPGDAYCTFHADPKIEKVRREFVDRAQ
ncbi:peptide-methionine (S)-S-oxide reductase MsrA [Halorubrum sp. DTA98]|uniref:peptide-methionine (S)-S-oxide reductase MsrA n=1 Tax=Halorubrum sp. DTA98 TaxID=3402163 RepID=UPI003AACB0D1